MQKWEYLQRGTHRYTAGVFADGMGDWQDTPNFNELGKEGTEVMI